MSRDQIGRGDHEQIEENLGVAAHAGQPMEQDQIEQTRGQPRYPARQPANPMADQDRRRRREQRRDDLILNNSIAAQHANGGVKQEQSRRFAIPDIDVGRSEEHTSELQSLMRISYDVFCLKKKKPSENS